MKANVSKAIVGALFCAMIVGNTAMAETSSETIEVFYNDTQIFVNGAEYVPKDEHGETIRPFTYDGKIYLPIEEVAQALDEGYKWEGETQTIYLGKEDQMEPDAYLSDLQHSYFTGASQHAIFYRVNGTFTDWNGEEYTNGIMVFADSYNSHTVKDDPDGAHVILEYPLNALYSRLSGKVVLPQNISTVVEQRKEINKSQPMVDILFYGDGTLLTKISSVNISMPMTFNVDLKGINKLTIKVIERKENGIYVGLTDLALYK
ncbi:MAG: stalk domain-containing protein [Lachnospiraceae bacterium]|nr:stalk domain-containing protein [Lachnospiraceae bacterium]